MKVARVHSGFAPRGVLPAAGTSVPAGTTINSTVEYTLVLVLLTARRLFFFFSFATDYHSMAITRCQRQKQIVLVCFQESLSLLVLVD
jgi:hypothetical protein